MPPLTKLLTGDQPTLRRIRTRATQSESGPFLDLVWEDADFDEMANNPGVSFETPEKRVIVHAVGDTVRYFAGHKDPGPGYSEYEIGTVGSVEGALQLTAAYLVDGLPLEGVPVPRQVRSRRPR
jgi:hypothetical protein